MKKIFIISMLFIFTNSYAEGIFSNSSEIPQATPELKSKKKVTYRQMVKSKGFEGEINYTERDTKKINSLLKSHSLSFQRKYTKFSNRYSTTKMDVELFFKITEMGNVRNCSTIQRDRISRKIGKEYCNIINNIKFDEEIGTGTFELRYPIERLL